MENEGPSTRRFGVAIAVLIGIIALALLVLASCGAFGGGDDETWAPTRTRVEGEEDDD